MGEKASVVRRAAQFLQLKLKSAVARIRGRHVPHPNPARDFPAAWPIVRGKAFSEWNGLRFEIVHTREGLLKIADGWRELTRGLKPARHFHHVEWFLALTRTMDEFDDRSYFFVAIFEAGKLVGIVPLRVKTVWINPGQRRVPVKALRLLSNIRETPSTRDVIFAESLVGVDIFTGLMRYLDSLNSWWDVLALTDVIEGSHAHAAFVQNSTLPSLTLPGAACGGCIDSISCGPGDDPFQRLTPGFKKGLRKAHNRLTALGPSFVRATTLEELQAAYPKLVAVEASGWKRDSALIIANHPRFDSFLKHLMVGFDPIHGCEIRLLQVGDRTIGGMFCVLSGGINFIHLIAYDEAHSRLSTGHLMLENLIKSEGEAGRIHQITSGHATSWFSADWKPDHVLTVSDHYLFRPTRRAAKLRERLARTATAPS